MRSGACVCSPEVVRGVVRRVGMGGNCRTCFSSKLCLSRGSRRGRSGLLGSIGLACAFPAILALLLPLLCTLGGLCLGSIETVASINDMTFKAAEQA
jgi:hypothetical protein